MQNLPAAPGAVPQDSHLEPIPSREHPILAKVPLDSLHFAEFRVEACCSDGRNYKDILSAPFEMKCVNEATCMYEVIFTAEKVPAMAETYPSYQLPGSLACPGCHLHLTRVAVPCRRALERCLGLVWGTV